MKTINITVLDNYAHSMMNQGCFDVEISSRISGQDYKIKAFVNEEKVVSVRLGVWIHGLFGNPPFQSEFVKRAEQALQNSFKNWTPELTELSVDI